MNETAYRGILRRLGVEPVTPLRPAADVARLTAMPLSVFAREGQLLEVRVPWWPETLYFVPSQRDAEALRGEGIRRHRVWTADELLSLLEGPPYAPGTLRIVIVARREFGGEVIAVRLRGVPDPLCPRPLPGDPAGDQRPPGGRRAETGSTGAPLSRGQA